MEFKAPKKNINDPFGASPKKKGPEKPGPATSQALALGMIVPALLLVWAAIIPFMGPVVWPIWSGDGILAKWTVRVTASLFLIPMAGAFFAQFYLAPQKKMARVAPQVASFSLWGAVGIVLLGSVLYLMGIPGI